MLARIRAGLICQQEQSDPCRRRRRLPFVSGASVALYRSRCAARRPGPVTRRTMHEARPAHLSESGH
jgi:hypothetical protein